jgi:hypothetical protein
MEHVHSAARQSTKVLEWIYIREKRFKNLLDKTPEV